MSQIQILTYDIFDSFREVAAFTSKRGGGVSTGKHTSGNLSFAVDDLDENVLANRHNLASTVGIPLERMVFPIQTHSDNIVMVDHDHVGAGTSDRASGVPDCDALITNVNNTCLVVLTADCAPVLIFASRARAIGVVHAGRAGVVKKIVTKTIKKMMDRYDCSNEELFVVVGPTIAAAHYPLSEDALAVVQQSWIPCSTLVTKDNLTHLDIRQAITDELQTMQIPSANISVNSSDTFAERDTFFSERRDAKPTGRFASGIFLKSLERDYSQECE